MKKIFFAAMAMLAIGIFAFEADAVISTFDTGLESWAAQDCVISHDSGGYLVSGDITDTWAYIVAPDKFHGSWSSTGSVSADIKFLATTGILFGTAFYVSNGSSAYEYEFSGKITTNWATYSALLNDFTWQNRTGSQTFAEVLQNVTQFKVRVDFNNFTDSLNDKSGLDNIRVDFAAAPLPSSLSLLIPGLVALPLLRRRRS